MESGSYQPTREGLLACYTAALPFSRNTLVGNFAFSLLLFVPGVY